MGAAATAGAVAAAASPTLPRQPRAAAPALTASNLAIAETPPDTLPASQVTVVPAGEITKLNVQEVLEALDVRLSKVQIWTTSRWR